MGQLNSKFRLARGGLYLHWCPGCERTHGIHTQHVNGWQFNGDVDNATFTPSVRVLGRKLPEPWDGVAPKVEFTECHYFITDGNIVFCSDSPHVLAGQTIPIPDWPYTPEEFHIPT